MSKEVELKRKQIKLAEKNLRKAINEDYKEIKKGNYAKDLKEYAGKDLSSIKVIMENGTIKTFEGLEILEVTDKGYLNISDFDWGLLKYDSKEKAYVHWYHFSKSVWHIKGFFDIEVCDE